MNFKFYKTKKPKRCNLARQLRLRFTHLPQSLALYDFYSFLFRPKHRKGFRQYLNLLLLFRVIVATYRAIASLLRTLPKLIEFAEPLFGWKLLEFIKSILNAIL